MFLEFSLTCNYINYVTRCFCPANNIRRIIKFQLQLHVPSVSNDVK